MSTVSKFLGYDTRLSSELGYKLKDNPTLIHGPVVIRTVSLVSDLGLEAGATLPASDYISKVTKNTLKSLLKYSFDLPVNYGNDFKFIPNTSLIIGRDDRLIRYEIVLHRKFTIINDYSGTGKTTLCRELNKARSPSLSTEVDSPYPYVLEGFEVNYTKEDDWESRLKGYSKSIIFIDEQAEWVKFEKFATIAKNSDNYFVIINRNNLGMLNYGISEIYRMDYDYKSIHHLVPAISHAKYAPEDIIFKPTYIITEDSNAGNRVFSAICDKSPKHCVSGGGKNNLFKELASEKYANEDVLVIADGSAFGSKYKDIEFLFKYKDRNIRFFLPESFEYLLLKLPMLRRFREVDDVVTNPEAYIDTTYNSWELFFTSYLRYIMSLLGSSYSKSSKALCFTENCCYRDKNRCTLYNYIEKTEATCKLEYLVSLIPNIDLSLLSSITGSLNKDASGLNDFSLYLHDDIFEFIELKEDDENEDSVATNIKSKKVISTPTKSTTIKNMDLSKFKT